MEELTIKVEKMDEFLSKADWICRAQFAFRNRSYDEEWKCFDKNGNHVYIGADFTAAEEIQRYPIGVYRLIRIAEKKP